MLFELWCKIDEFEADFYTDFHNLLFLENLSVFTVTMGCCLCGVSSFIVVDDVARMIIKVSGKKRSIQYDLWKVIFECDI